MGNGLSLSYGIKVENTSVLCTNLFGLGCQVAWLTCTQYVVGLKGPASVSWVWFALRGSAALNSGLFLCHALTANQLGQLIIVLNIVLFASPLAKLGDVIRNRDAS